VLAILPKKLEVNTNTSTSNNSSTSSEAKGGEPVAVQCGRLMGCTFHPELSNDRRWHQYFINIVQQATQSIRPTTSSTATTSSNSNNINNKPK